MVENIKNIPFNSQELDLVKTCLKLELISITDNEDWIMNNKEEVEKLEIYLQNQKKMDMIKILKREKKEMTKKKIMNRKKRKIKKGMIIY